jgi:hypothetical protein
VLVAAAQPKVAAAAQADIELPLGTQYQQAQLSQLLSVEVEVAAV